MALEAVKGVGAEDGVRSRVVGIRVHRVGTVEVVRRRKRTSCTSNAVKMAATATQSSTALGYASAENAQ
jgi:hypothetical protein